MESGKLDKWIKSLLILRCKLVSCFEEFKGSSGKYQSDEAFVYAESGALDQFFTAVNFSRLSCLELCLPIGRAAPLSPCPAAASRPIHSRPDRSVRGSCIISRLTTPPAPRVSPAAAGVRVKNCWAAREACGWSTTSFR